MSYLHNRNIKIDIVKFVCSILIITVHVPVFGIQSKGTILWLGNQFFENYLSRIAVPFFFICNGFFLFNKYNKNQDSKIIKTFVYRMIFLYIIWTIFYLPVKYKDIIYNKNGIDYGIKFYIKSFIFSGSYAQLWYLNALVFATVVIYLLLKLKMKPKNILTISVLFYFVGIFGDAYKGFITNIPFLVKIYKIYTDYFLTTRNGLFFAFLFVSIGMYISTSKQKNYNNSLLLFIVSMICLLLETYLLAKFQIAKDYNMTLSIIPASYFLFVFCLNNRNLISTDLPFGEISRLTYFGHKWVNYIIENVYERIAPILNETPITFISVTLITIGISLFVIKISSFEKYKFIKKLY